LESSLQIYFDRRSEPIDLADNIGISAGISYREPFRFRYSDHHGIIISGRILFPPHPRLSRVWRTFGQPRDSPVCLTSALRRFCCGNLRNLRLQWFISRISKSRVRRRGLRKMCLHIIELASSFLPSQSL
jgi:hypothetical protein